MSYWVIERNPGVGNRRYARLSKAMHSHGLLTYLWQSDIHLATKFLRRRDAEGLAGDRTFVAEHEDVDIPREIEVGKHGVIPEMEIRA